MYVCVCVCHGLSMCVRPPCLRQSQRLIQDWHWWAPLCHTWKHTWRPTPESLLISPKGIALACPAHTFRPQKNCAQQTHKLFTHTDTHTHTHSPPAQSIAVCHVNKVKAVRRGGSCLNHDSQLRSLSNCHCRTAFTWHAHTHAHTRRAKVTFASSQTLPSDTEAVHSLCSLSHTSSSLYISHPTCVAMGENIGLVNKPLRSDHDLFLTPSCLTFYFTWLRHLSSPCPGITRYYKCVSVKHAL